jgi:DNA-binding CsgD family transcriptional regulator
MPNLGDFTKSMITQVPITPLDDKQKVLKQNLQRFPEEAIYIYSFKENKMLYADGWEEVLGYRDDEINMLQIVSITTPEYAPFSHELNDKALLFIMQKHEDLEKYSFTIELKKFHKLGHEIPLIVRVGVFASENGNVTEIIGRSQINHSIALGKVMRYAAYGPEKSEFEEQLNKDLFKHFAISRKEKEALELVAKGYSFKEIATMLSISVSAAEKRVFPLFKRFDVKGTTHLITFAYENHILH